jgi:hypothetical protein
MLYGAQAFCPTSVINAYNGVRIGNGIRNEVPSPTTPASIHGLHRAEESDATVVATFEDQEEENSHGF